MSTTTTDIAWTDRTWNPTRGCSIVSPGCTNCYAMKLAHRFSGPGKPYDGLTKQTPRSGPQWTGKVTTVESALLEPLSWRKPQRVFVNSMSDLFHQDVPDAFIDQVFATMAAGHNHTFQVLTKRPERMRRYVSDSALQDRIHWASLDRFGHTKDFDSQVDSWVYGRWPLPNVWLGVSVEDQPRADERIPLLLQTPAAVRFISAEPLLGSVDLTRIDYTENLRATARDFAKFQGWDPAEVEADITGPSVIDALRGRWNDGEDSGDYERKLDWVIVGGESGPGARPFDLAWARSIVQQCQAAGVACFMKQLGKWPSIDGEQIDGWMPLHNQHGEACGSAPFTGGHGKHDEPSEWPADLRVREFPAVLA